jgi:hypothetical protein
MDGPPLPGHMYMLHIIIDITSLIPEFFEIIHSLIKTTFLRLGNNNVLSPKNQLIYNLLPPCLISYKIDNKLNLTYK